MQLQCSLVQRLRLAVAATLAQVGGRASQEPSHLRNGHLPLGTEGQPLQGMGQQVFTALPVLERSLQGIGRKHLVQRADQPLHPQLLLFARQPIAQDRLHQPVHRQQLLLHLPLQQRVGAQGGDRFIEPVGIGRHRLQH